MRAINADTIEARLYDIAPKHYLTEVLREIIKDAPTVSASDVLGVDQDKVLVLPDDLTVSALIDMYSHANECGEADSAENWTTGYRAGKKAGYVELLRLILGVEKDEVSDDD